ncbi:MAG TPA: murein biosynthesis integral membrane protein MurJ [Streptosporangiaceae bacterium]|nr:murein biosynthesis integral membrane protein MurJ [Streptosporangiaceae bacterium]
MTTPGSQAGPTAADPDYRSPVTRRPAAGYDYEADLPPGWPGTAPAPGSGTEAGPGESGWDGTEPADTFPGPAQAAPEAAGTGTGLEAAETTAGTAGTGTGTTGTGTTGTGTTGTGTDEPAGASVMRSSGIMAIGTLASRGTGLLRTLVQAYALGAFALANAYNNANTLPNAVYNLVIGGILTSVIVPLLVNAAKRDRDRGEAYDQRMFTLITVALLVLTVVATAAAALLVDLYKGRITGPELHLMIVFAYFFIPQIFFYGISSLAGAILNARGSFAAPMWTPVVNNVVVIAVLLMFMGVAGFGASPVTITGTQITLLGLGTTLGIVAQTAALVPALRRVKFRWRPRFDFRRAEVTEIGRMAGWMFGYIASTQVAFLVTTRVANSAGVAAQKAHVAYGAGFTPYTYAWQLFQMPYAIVGISVITALLPRMSAHAAERKMLLVAGDFSAGVRLSSVIVVPSALVLAALGPGLAETFLAYGSTSVADARYLGEVFAIFCLGLLPYMFFQLQLRVFYALHDSRTPALIGLLTMVVNIVTNLLALEILPPGQVVAGLGVGFGLANLAGTVVAWRILSRRIGGLDGRAVTGSLIRMHLAAIPPALFAIAVSLMVGVVLPAGHLNAVVTVTIAGCGALLLYVMFARALRVGELADLTKTVTARFRR